MNSNNKVAMSENAEKAPNEGRRDVLKLAGAGLVTLGVASMTSSKVMAQSELKLSDEWIKHSPKATK